MAGHVFSEDPASDSEDPDHGIDMRLPHLDCGTSLRGPPTQDCRLGRESGWGSPKSTRYFEPPLTNGTSRSLTK